MRLTSASSKTCVFELTSPDISIFTSKREKNTLSGKQTASTCQLLLTEHVPSNQNLVTLRVVRKRIGLTAQTTDCLRCDDSPRSVPFRFICLLLSLLFVIFLKLLRKEHPKHTNFTSLKEIQSLLQNKVYFLFKSNTFVMASFTLADESSSIYKLRISITTAMIVCYYFVQRHHLGAELQQVKV